MPARSSRERSLSVGLADTRIYSSLIAGRSRGSLHLRIIQTIHRCCHLIASMLDREARGGHHVACVSSSLFIAELSFLIFNFVIVAVFQIIGLDRLFGTAATSHSSSFGARARFGTRLLITTCRRHIRVHFHRYEFFSWASRLSSSSMT